MSGKTRALVGRRFGMLMVEGVDTPKRLPSGQVQQMLKCRCDCGNCVSVSYSHLVYGGTKSCGCIKHKPRYADLTGQKFNLLTVVRHIGRVRIGTGEQYSQLWECQCDCGKKCNVDSRSLKSGNTKSCGCIQGEKYRSHFLNSYDLNGEYGIGWFNNGDKFLFDIDDYPIISKYTWYKSDSGYASTVYKNQRMRMHRMILGLKDFDIHHTVDHINHDTCDNRRSNLRICTQAENNRNKCDPSNNTSGHIGVGYLPLYNKYRAYIDLNGVQISLGTFNTFEEAVRARESGEKKYFAEYAIQR